MLLVKDNEVLLGRRIHTGWQDGNYGLPSGHLEPNESLIQGAIREAGEEMGVVIKEEDVRFVHLMHRMDKYMDVFFVATKWSGEPQIMEADKCDEIGWFPLDSLPTNIVPSVKYAIDEYVKEIYFSEFNQDEG